jgi:hypothetical protein
LTALSASDAKPGLVMIADSKCNKYEYMILDMVQVTCLQMIPGQLCLKLTEYLNASQGSNRNT